MISIYLSPFGQICQKFLWRSDLLKDIQGKRKTRRHVGRLVSANNQKVALFKYKGTVCAVDELCPHMGK